MTKLTFTRQRDNSFTREGAVTSRRVTVRIYRDGLWSRPLAPINRKHIVEQIEREISLGALHLAGERYELTEVASEMSDETRTRLKRLGEESESEEE